LAKKFIKKITYSKENIKIALYYPENLKGSKNEKTSALLSQGGAEKSENEEKNCALDGEREFVSKMMAPKSKHLRTFETPPTIYIFITILLSAEPARAFRPRRNALASFSLVFKG